MQHKAGFVNIIGNPNVGKSTIMNALVDEKLSIITSKSQTTRHRIMGIVNGEDFQIVYSDTPGFLKPNYKLQDAMLKYAKSALQDADVLLYVTDIFEKSDKHKDLIEKVKKVEVPLLLLINKIDLSNQEQVNSLSDYWSGIFPNAEIIALSALKNFNLDILLDKIITHLPESPPYFPKDQLTDKSERFFVSEIIREKILLNYKKEVPYSVEIEIEEFKNTEKLISIRSIIYVARESQKGIIIGHKGEKLKKTGTEARIDMETFLDKKVYLQLYVKVQKDWRNKQNALKRFGYTN